MRKKVANPGVSVIIPVYNAERFIGRCIRSALNQSIPNQDYEIIVIDDACTDRTRYALDLFGTEIRVLSHPEKRGLPSALNTGIHAAKGRYIVRLDSDDYVSREYLNVLKMFLDLNSAMDAVACDYVLVNDREEIIRRVDCMREPLGCGIMFRKDQLIDIGLYDPEFLIHEDRDLRHRFLQRYNIERVSLPLYRYRRHEQNMTNDVGEAEKFEKNLEQKHGLLI